MGAPNAALNVYMSKNERIRDVFEFYINSNLPDGLSMYEADGVYSLDDNKKLTTRERDKIKKVESKDGDVFYLAVENQMTVNLTFPQRILEMDSLEYGRQVEAIRAKNVAGKVNYTHEDDFKYRFKSDDRLAPVITLKLYWGARNRRMPHSLWDMMNLEWLPEPIKSVVNDYKIHTMNVLEIPDEALGNMRSDLKYVIGLIKCKRQGSRWQGFIQEHAGYFERIPKDAFDVIRVLAGIKDFARYVFVDSKSGEECVNMCKAIKDIRREGRREGVADGIQIGETNIINKLIEKGIIKKEEAEEIRRELALNS